MSNAVCLAVFNASVIFSETIVIPVVLTGWYLFEPISYEPPKKDTLFYIKQKNEFEREPEHKKKVDRRFFAG